jgi:hypothetical protein
MRPGIVDMSHDVIRVEENHCEKLPVTRHTDNQQLSSTEDAIYDTPSKIDPPAQQSDEPRSATDLMDSRLATPRASSIDRSRVLLSVM